ncbi:MAG: HNH endonuclease signature motif containing protein [Patescibacteria group bacterium]
MSLLENYKRKNTNKAWFDDHFSLGKDNHGRMFEYTNTNFRNQDSFIDHFSKFLEVENKPREEWPKQANHGQEVHKHMVINMIQSKLFKKDVNEIFSRTAKGLLYTDFINSDYENGEKWLINYLFLLNGYYFSRKNYIIYRIKEDLLGFLLSVDNLEEQKIIEYAKKLLESKSISDVLRNEFFYLHSFYNDSDFLINYLRAPIQEKEELAVYIEQNLKNKTFDCCISAKYQTGGNFTVNTLFDETKVFLLTLLFIQTENVNLSNIYQVFVKNYSQNIERIDTKIVSNYLSSNNNVFDSVFLDVLEIEELDITLADDVSESEAEATMSADTPEEYIDETSEEGRQKIKAVFALRKKQAKIQGEYKCGLETINNCKPIYFTAKTNGKNYLELHHFIPREFRNDFSNSIEVLANYVTLCPRCHRQIHLAVDRERKALIHSLFEERKARLDTVGINVDLKNIYKYYKIDS